MFRRFLTCVDAAEGDLIVRPIVALFRFYGLHIRLLRRLIERELALTSTVATLFRRNSAASKALTTYTTITGLSYLSAVLSKFCQSVIDSPDEVIEIDMTKIKDRVVSPIEEVAFSKNLVERCKQCLKTIFNSLDHCPVSFRYVAYMLKFYVKQRWPEADDSAWERAIAGFFFLRFVCPALVSPHTHGMVNPASLTATTRRKFLLIAKALQNLANGVVFSTKGNTYPIIDQWLNAFSPKMSEFLRGFATLPQKSDYCSTATSATTKLDILQALAALEHVTTTKLEKIVSFLEDPEARRINLLGPDPYELVRDLLSFHRTLQSSGFLCSVRELIPNWLSPYGLVKALITVNEHASEPDSDFFILNHQIEPLKPKKTKDNPTLYVEGLLHDLCSLIKQYHVHGNSLRASSAFLTFIERSSRLRRFDMQEFQSLSQKKQKAFWLNCFHLLMLHSMVNLVPTTKITRVGFFEMFRYYIGEHTWSLSDIYAILRSNQMTNNQTRSSYFTKNDPRKGFALEKLDHRIHFGICHFSQNLLNKFQIYNNDVDDQLNFALQYICDRCIVVDPLKNELKIPHFFQHFEDDFKSAVSPKQTKGELLHFEWMEQFFEVYSSDDQTHPIKNHWQDLKKTSSKNPTIKVQPWLDVPYNLKNLEVIKKVTMQDSPPHDQTD